MFNENIILFCRRYGVVIAITAFFLWTPTYIWLGYPMGWNEPAASHYYHEAMNRCDSDGAIYWAKRMIYYENGGLHWHPLDIYGYLVIPPRPAELQNNPNSRGNRYLRKAYKLKSDLEQSREQEKNAKPAG